MTAEYDFGMIGLGVMGSNLLLNMADHGFRVIGYDKNPLKTASLESSATPGTVVKGVNSLPEMVAALKTPRRIMMLVPAGPVVDSVINDITPLLEHGDILIDGGNSHYSDTLRRLTSLKDRFHFMGIGISGGEQGARTGPSIMPGGDIEAYTHLEAILKEIAAKVNDEPCVAYMGNGAAGHFVKMVHNGIEYAIMQLISECYDLLHNGLGLSNDELHVLFSNWNKGPLNSFLIEITAAVFKANNDKGEGRLIDVIMDKAGSKGTGKWTSQAALDLGVPVPLIDAAVMMRNLSSLKEDRIRASSLLDGTARVMIVEKDVFISRLHNALLFSAVTAYAQGLALLTEASKVLGMEIPVNKVVHVWSGGCIIRSALLPVFRKAYEQDGGLTNLLLDKKTAALLSENYEDAVAVCRQAIGNGYPVSALCASVNYYNSYRRAELPVNLIQAQRDFFGAHTFQRKDMEGTFHYDWN